MIHFNQIDTLDSVQIDNQLTIFHPLIYFPVFLELHRIISNRTVYNAVVRIKPQTSRKTLDELLSLWIWLFDLYPNDEIQVQRADFGKIQIVSETLVFETDSSLTGNIELTLHFMDGGCAEAVFSGEDHQQLRIDNKSIYFPEGDAEYYCNLDLKECLNQNRKSAIFPPDFASYCKQRITTLKIDGDVLLS